MDLVHILDIGCVEFVARQRTKFIELALKFCIQLIREIDAARLRDGLHFVADERVVVHHVHSHVL